MENLILWPWAPFVIAVLAIVAFVLHPQDIQSGHYHTPVE